MTDKQNLKPFGYFLPDQGGMRLIYRALSHAETICDRVPTLVHLPQSCAPIEFQEIGRLVNFQEDSGFHGYALISDAKAHVCNLIKETGHAIGQTLPTEHEHPNIAQNSEYLVFMEEKKLNRLKEQRDYLLEALKTLRESYLEAGDQMSREQRIAGRKALLKASAAITQCEQEEII